MAKTKKHPARQFLDTFSEILRFLGKKGDLDSEFCHLLDRTKDID
ncbi:MAG: hypothetical protein ISEC1_P1859 [Thiomicrorhabdus sp.]|nr:MAG: hypothetical protein ISEC1_P1859 [Thiomicrorhabdus sp.]